MSKLSEAFEKLKTIVPKKSSTPSLTHLTAWSLLAFSAFSFFMFFKNLLSGPSLGGNTLPPIAHLVSGNIQQRRFGAASFDTIKTDAPLFNRDALWVPKNEEALVLFESGTYLKLNPETFLILKKGSGLTPETSGEAESAEARVFTGSASVEPPKGLIAGLFAPPPVQLTGREGNRISNGEAPTSLPSASVPAPRPSAPSLEEQKETLSKVLPESNKANLKIEDLRPAQGALFFVLSPDKKSIKVTFGWRPKISGTLTLQSKANGSIQNLKSIDLLDSDQTEVDLPILAKEDSSYLWTLTPKSQAVKLENGGPHEFGIRPFSQKTLEEILKKDPRRSIEVIE